MPSPINFEFRQIVGEYNMGKPLEQTLQEARNRLRSENFALFAAAMMASHQSGGRLNEIVERIAQAVLEMQRLERKVRAETAQARKSAVYMAIAPVGDRGGLLLCRSGEHAPAVSRADGALDPGGGGGSRRAGVFVGPSDFDARHIIK